MNEYKCPICESKNYKILAIGEERIIADGMGFETDKDLLLCKKCGHEYEVK